MACGARCFEKYQWSWAPLYRPPPGGYTIREMPPELLRDKDTQARLAYVWKNLQRAQNNSPDDAVSEMIGFLRQNGCAVLPEMRLKIEDWADDDFCSREPARCVNRPSRDPEPQKTILVQELATSTMSWAPRFWMLWNTALASDQENPQAMMERWSLTALDLVISEAGCKECESHWRSHIAALPPAVLCTTSRKSRIWLWASHNFARPGKTKTPWIDIQKGWHWPAIPPQEVADTLVEMGMDKL